MRLIPAMRLALLLIAVANIVMCLANMPFIFWRFHWLNVIAVIAMSCSSAFALYVRRKIRYD